MSAMLPRRLHAQRAVTVLEDTARGSRPTDQILETLFRIHKEMGKRDRAAVSTLVYGVLRDAMRLRGLAGDAPAAWLSRHLADAGHGAAEIASLELPVPCGDGEVSAAARLNLTADLHARLVSQIGEAETAALALALNQPAPTDVRVNTLKTTREAALAALQAAGLDAAPLPYAPQGLRLAQRLSRQSPLLLEGQLEPQDEGSQLLARFASAAPGQTVIDWCAGAGGKTLALAAAMQNRGRLIAADVKASRLARLPPRALRAGTMPIETVVLGVDAMPVNDADLVLVDAPCSGTGTWRRNPELRLRAFDLDALAALQLDLLDSASRHVRAGGHLVHATCSLLQEENEAVVTRFLAAHPDFAPADATADVALHPLLDTQGRLRLWPHRHGTDGFFAQRLLRRA